MIVYVIAGGAALGLSIAAWIAPDYIDNSEQDQELLELNSKVPEGYYDLPKPKPKPAPKPKPMSFEFVEDEPNYVELKRQEIISKLTIDSFENNILTQEKNEYELPEFKEPKEAKPKNVFLTSDNFGLKKNEASFRVKLNRTITADKMFSAILITAVNSHLKGKVLAMIEDNIYASHGRNILIPQGSKAIGWYIPLKRLGKERLAISWTRIITPAGVNINLKALSADIMGRSGAIGDLDNRYFARYGLALTISTASNAISYVALKNTPSGDLSNEDTLKIDVIDDYKKDITSLTNEVLKEQLQIQPSINIDPGTRIFINPIADIWFSQPENNNINVSLVNQKTKEDKQK